MGKLIRFSHKEYLIETKKIDFGAPIIREKILGLRNGTESKFIAMEEIIWKKY